MKSESERTTEEAYRYLVEPLAKVFVRLGIGVGEFANVCKAAYVNAAAAKVRLKNGRVNRSRVAVITGLTRAEVTRLLTVGKKPRQPWHRHRAARVLDGWFSDPQYRTRSGRPKDLPKNGRTRSFRSLVRKYSGDIPAKAVLEELLNSDAVEVRKNGMLRAKRRRIVAQKLSNKVVAEIGIKAGRLLATLIHNIEHPADRWFEASVTKTRVDSALVPYLRKDIAVRGAALLDVVADQLEHPLSDLSAKSIARPPVTLNVGMYLHIGAPKSKSAGGRIKKC